MVTAKRNNTDGTRLQHGHALREACLWIKKMLIYVVCPFTNMYNTTVLNVISQISILIENRQKGGARYLKFTGALAEEATPPRSLRNPAFSISCHAINATTQHALSKNHLQQSYVICQSNNTRTCKFMINLNEFIHSKIQRASGGEQWRSFPTDPSGYFRNVSQPSVVWMWPYWTRPSRQLNVFVAVNSSTMKESLIL